MDWWKPPPASLKNHLEFFKNSVNNRDKLHFILEFVAFLYQSFHSKTHFPTNAAGQRAGAARDWCFHHRNSNGHGNDQYTGGRWGAWQLKVGSLDGNGGYVYLHHESWLVHRWCDVLEFGRLGFKVWRWFFEGTNRCWTVMGYTILTCIWIFRCFFFNFTEYTLFLILFGFL